MLKVETVCCNHCNGPQVLGLVELTKYLNYNTLLLMVIAGMKQPLINHRCTYCNEDIRIKLVDYIVSKDPNDNLTNVVIKTEVQ